MFCSRGDSLPVGRYTREATAQEIFKRYDLGPVQPDQPCHLRVARPVES